MFHYLKALQEKPEAKGSCGEFPKIIIVIVTSHTGKSEL